MFPQVPFPYPHDLGVRQLRDQVMRDYRSVLYVMSPTKWQLYAIRGRGHTLGHAFEARGIAQLPKPVFARVY